MSEKQYYRRHYNGGVKVGTRPLDVFEQEMTIPGGRYNLLVECLANDNPTKGCIAEIGCGGAEALLILSRRYRFDRVIGVDIATIGDAPETLTVLDCNLNDKWPFADAEIDYLIAMAVIEHLFDPFHAFGEIKRCMKYTGSAFVNIPLVTGIRNRFRLMCGRLPETSIPYVNWYETGEWDGNHLHYFSARSICDLARACGLHVTDLRGVGKFHRAKTRLPQLLASEVTFRLQHADFACG